MVQDQPQPEVFTRGFKIRGNLVTASLTLFLFAVPFFGGIGAAWLIGRRWGDAAGGTAVLGAVLVTIGVTLVANQKVFLYGNAALRRDLAAALERRYGRNPDDGRSWFVGWAPGRGFNPKEMDTDHDIGFLSLTPEEMVYLGDTVHFELWRQQVHSVGAKLDGVPVLVDLAYRICVEWIDAYGQSNAFTLERREGRSRRQVRRNTRQLAEILQQWQQTGAVPA